MQRKRRDRCLFVGLGGALVVLCAALPAHAVPNCHSLTATAVAFGNYDVYSAATKVIPGTITYNCRPPTVATITIDAGLHPAAGQRAMQLTTGSDLLTYDIFRDSTCLIRWDPSLSTGVAAGNGSLSFWACLAGSQDVSVGS